MPPPTSRRFRALAHPPLRPRDRKPDFSPILAKTAGAAAALRLLQGSWGERAVLGSRSPFPGPSAGLEGDQQIAGLRPGDVSQSQDGQTCSE